MEVRKLLKNVLLDCRVLLNNTRFTQKEKEVLSAMYRDLENSAVLNAENPSALDDKSLEQIVSAISHMISLIMWCQKDDFDA
jgi:hypothetical protein